MAKEPSATGFQPRTTPAERRAFFDLQRQLKVLEDSGGSGGGGGVADVLWVGPNPPTDSSIELWWDTDEPGTAGITQTEADARYPLGVVAYAQTVTNSSIITNAMGITDLAGLSVTFTAVAGRSYRVTGSLYCASTVAQDVPRMHITDGANNLLQYAACLLGRVSVAESLERSVILSTLSGSTTLKLRLQLPTGSGNLTNIAGPLDPSFILVEDLGIL